MRTLKRLALGLGSALVAVVLLHPAAIAQQIACAGSFTPQQNCLIPGTWNFAPTNGTTAYDVPYWANGSEATGVVSKVVDLTDAQVKLLGTTPVTLVAAPGIGKFVDVISISVIFKYTAAYSSVGDVRCFWGSRTTGNACSATITASGLFDATANTAVRASGVPDGTRPPVTNLPIVLQKLSLTQMAGGNAANSVRVVVNYRIVATNLST